MNFSDSLDALLHPQMNWNDLIWSSQLCEFVVGYVAPHYYNVLYLVDFGGFFFLCVVILCSLDSSFCLFLGGPLNVHKLAQTI